MNKNNKAGPKMNKTEKWKPAFGLNQEHGLGLGSDTAKPFQTTNRTVYDQLEFAHRQLHGEYSQKELQLECIKAHAERLAELLKTVRAFPATVTPEQIDEALAAWEGMQEQGRWHDPENESDSCSEDGRSDGYGESYAERNT